MLQLFVFSCPEVASPDDAGPVDIGFVVDPLVLEDMLRRVSNEDEQITGNFRKPLVDLDPALWVCVIAFGVVMIDRVPRFVASHREREVGSVEYVEAVKEDEMNGAEEDDQAGGVVACVH